MITYTKFILSLICALLILTLCACHAVKDQTAQDADPSASASASDLVQTDTSVSETDPETIQTIDASVLTSEAAQETGASESASESPEAVNTPSEYYSESELVSDVNDTDDANEEMLTISENTESVESTTESVRWRDDIVSDGQYLSHELQEIMQDYCEEYSVPYALALAVAEVESHFDPDAESSTGDYGLMQINVINHGWLKDIGIDPLTYTGNIESGVYMLSQYLEDYGDTEMAVMAYVCGPTGAKQLWDSGVYQTEYSRNVMTAYAYWASVLEG